MNKDIMLDNSVDEVIKQRETQKESEGVDISGSLADEYNVDIFGEDEADLNKQYEEQEIFVESSNLDDASVSQSYKSLFTADLNYHQTVKGQITSNHLMIIWLVMIVLISIVLSKIVNVKRKNANKNRTYSK